VKSDVRASLTPTANLTAQPRTYALARAPFAESSTQSQYEALVGAALAKHGFTVAREDEARYRVSLAYETHGQRTSVARGASGACHTSDQCGCAGNGGQDDIPVFSWPWQHTFVHSVTVRFFERSSGTEIYKVCAVSLNHDPAPQRAMPYLVESALSRLPYPGTGRWLVTLEPASDVAKAGPGQHGASQEGAGQGGAHQLGTVARVVAAKPLDR
jgi:hypothetical protein